MQGYIEHVVDPGKPVSDDYLFFRILSKPAVNGITRPRGQIDGKSGIKWKFNHVIKGIIFGVSFQ